MSNVQPPFSWRYLTPIYTGSTLNPINSSLLATALVPIATALHVGIGATTVLVTSLYLASAVAQPTAGKVAEVFGPRRTFLVGIILVFIGGLVGAWGQTLTVLIVSRVLIGIGTSAGYPSAMLMIRKRAEDAGLEKPPGAVLGGLQITSSAVVALGLPLGGVLVDAWGWRTVFLINVPFALFAFATALMWIPRDAPLPKGLTPRSVAERIDLIGILGFATTMTALLGFFFSLQQPNWLLLAGGLVVGAALVRWELRVQQPFIDVRLLATNGSLNRVYLRFGLMMLCGYTVLYGLTQWLQAARGISSREAGLLLLPMTLLSIFIVRPISERNLVRGPLIAAAASSLMGSIGILLLGTTSPIAWVVIITLLFGVTLSTASVSNQLTLYSSVTAAQLGTASGLFRTFGYLGSIVSSAMIGIVFHDGATQGGLHTIGTIMIAVSAFALILTLADRTLRRTSTTVAAAAQPTT